MRVMVPPDGIGVVGAKDSVMGTMDLWAIRSEREMLSMTDATEVVGAATTASVAPATAVTIAPFVNVNCTDDAAIGVPAPMMTTAVVAFATVQDAAVAPVLGSAPTLALHKKPGMKLAPDTVMVLPT